MRAHMRWYEARISHLTSAAASSNMSYSVWICPAGPGVFFERTCPLKQGCGRSMSVRNKDMWASKLMTFWWYVAAYLHPDVPAISIAEWPDADLCVGLLHVLNQENAPHQIGPHAMKFSKPWYDTYFTCKNTSGRNSSSLLLTCYMCMRLGVG
jgi:hypothetical protein